MAKPITPEMFAAQGSEDAHQIALFCWAQQNKHIHPELEWLFAIPNGGSRHKAEAGKLVAAGVKRGVPDIMLPVVKFAYAAGLFIELKKPKNHLGKEGAVRDDQNKWHNYLNSGYHCVVCYGWEAARDAILEYLGK